MKKYGFIGTGNMGSALAEAIVKKVGPENRQIFYDLSHHGSPQYVHIGTK